MAVPKHRKSVSRRDMRRAQNVKLAVQSLSACPQCRRAKLPHRVCLYCGFYKGREVVALNQA